MGLPPRRLLALATMAVLFGLAPAAAAERFVPTTRNDPNPDGCKKNHCSLREAVIDANADPGHDVIVLHGGRPYKLKGADGEDASASGDLDVTSDILVRGRPRATIDANKHDRIFHLPQLTGGQLVVAKLTLTGGSSSAILAATGDLSVRRSKVVRNKVTEAQATGGGIAVTDVATAAIRRTTISQNKGGAGGGLYAGGMTTVRQSTISGNTSGGTGGGIKSQSASLKITNSTVAKNKAGADGGGMSVISGTTTINNVTIARNTADADGTGGSDVGGGITASGATINVDNSIIALNKLGGSPMPLADRNCDGTFNSGGGNVRNTSDPGCVGFVGTNDIEKNPQLEQLARNGGPTKTMALKPGSPAINNAIPASAQKRDQRGHRRGGNPDSGAYER